MKIKQFLPFVIWIVVLVLVLVFYIIPKEEEALLPSPTLQLIKDNKELTIKNEHLDTKVNLLKKQADSLNAQILNSNITIQKLHHELKEKINTIHTMSGDELYSYFAEFRTDSTAH